MSRAAHHLISAAALTLHLAGSASGCRAAGAPSDLAAALHEAERANMSHQLTRERELLERAERLEGDPEDAAEVQRRLAVLDWRYQRQDDRARRRLQRAIGASRPALAWLALARLEQDRERFDAAAAAASRALETAEKQKDRRDARLAWATAVVELAVAARREGRRGLGANLTRARAQLDEELHAEIGLQKRSLLLLYAGLLLDEGETTAFAFRSFYQMSPGSPPPNAFPEAANDLLRLLEDWRGARASSEDRIHLARALAGTRLYVAASLIALDPRADDEVRADRAVGENLAYLRFTDRLRARIDEHYRLCLLGDCDGSRQKREREAELKLFKEELQHIGDLPPNGDILATVEKRFGGHLNVGYTAGYPDTHYGHSVVDERRTVEQYARRAEVRFVLLDHMVSNGFQSWAWENDIQHGGWARSDVIYQVRQPHVSEIMAMAHGIEDDEERAEFEKEMREETERDEERARENPYAYLPGLRKRMQLQVASQIYDRVQQQLRDGDDLRLRFIEELDRVAVESFIFAHEGRHAIDAIGADPDGPAWRLEYQAKLSQVVFAEEPRLAIVPILAANIGDETPHGKANLEVVKNLVEWMRRNREAIRGLEPDRPLLPQLDLLTDEQLKTALREMDPLAKH